MKVHHLKKTRDVLKRTIIRVGLSDTQINISSGLKLHPFYTLPFEAVWYMPIMTAAIAQCCIILLEFTRMIKPGKYLNLIA